MYHLSPHFGDLRRFGERSYVRGWLYLSESGLGYVNVGILELFGPESNVDCVDPSD